jgi:hypothetical protein
MCPAPSYPPTATRVAFTPMLLTPRPAAHSPPCCSLTTLLLTPRPAAHSPPCCSLTTLLLTPRPAAHSPARCPVPCARSLCRGGGRCRPVGRAAGQRRPADRVCSQVRCALRCAAPRCCAVLCLSRLHAVRKRGSAHCSALCPLAPPNHPAALVAVPLLCCRSNDAFDSMMAVAGVNATGLLDSDLLTSLLLYHIVPGARAGSGQRAGASRGRQSCVQPAGFRPPGARGTPAGVVTEASFQAFAPPPQPPLPPVRAFSKVDPNAACRRLPCSPAGCL